MMDFLLLTLAIVVGLPVGAVFAMFICYFWFAIFNWTQRR